MIFVSWTFAAFFVVIFAAYYGLCKTGGQQVFVLVVGSLIFYGYDNSWLLVLLISCSVAAAAISHVVAGPARPGHRYLVAAGIGMMLLVLAGFKYKLLIWSTLFASTVPTPLVRHFLDLALPVGISFYTFHAISLMVDTYSRKVDPKPGTPFQTRLSETLLYTVFFPQLVAGPITKAREFLPQIAFKRFAEIRFRQASYELINGLFLKLVIADNLAAQTLWIKYPEFTSLGTAKLVWLLVGYSCQIFADFAGYSLIAMGLARLFGYALPINFDRPYIADSFSDFWRRWHITLSRWLRDYLYIPLGGDRRGSARTYVNLMMVMVFGGLWHGAGWNFAAWGALHGTALVLERPFRQTWFLKSEQIGVRAIRALIVFSVVTLGWLAFKLHGLDEMTAYLAAIYRNSNIPSPARDLLALQIYCIPILLLHVLPAQRVRPWLREMALASMLLLILLNSGTPTAFIYFQF